MSKELADRLENLAVHLKGTVYLHPEHVTALGEAIAALRSEPVYQQDALDMADKRADARHNKLNIDSVEPVAGQLSAEQINQYKQFASRLRSGDGILDEPLDWNALSEAIHTAADTIDALVPMALSSLRSEPVALVNAHLEVEWLEKITVMPGLKLYAAPSRETAKRSATSTQEGLGRLWNAQTAKPEAEPALSAEQIKKFQWNYNKHDGMGNPDGWVNTLCNMALSSLTARDEGIEAAAKLASKSPYRDVREFAADILTLKGGK